MDNYKQPKKGIRNISNKDINQYIDDIPMEKPVRYSNNYSNNSNYEDYEDYMDNYVDNYVDEYIDDIVEDYVDNSESNDSNLNSNSNSNFNSEFNSNSNYNSNYNSSYIDEYDEIPFKRGFKVPEHKLTTKITEVKPNEISTRGFNQVDLISNLSYAEMVFLILKGRLPSKKESKMFNHCLVSFVDHGVTPPSTQSARLIASSGSPLNNAVAGGLLSFGKNHAGAIEKSMKLLQDGIKSLNLDKIDPRLVNKYIARLAINIVNEYEAKSERIPGFGHRYHDKDPRAVRLIDLAILESAIGPHTKLALVIESILSERKGICLNVDGANAGLLSDLGFDSKLGIGIFMIGRLPGLVAHSFEEMREEDKFRRFCDLEDIVYEGLQNKSIK